MARPRSYAWAYQTSVANRPRSPLGLSSRARKGLEWARLIADDHRERARAGRGRDTRLTPADLAWRLGLARSTVYGNIALARLELFGELKDSAPYARLRRWRERPQLCAEPGCEHPPRLRVADKPGPWPRYCAEHAAPAARTRRNRRPSS